MPTDSYTTPQTTPISTSAKRNFTFTIISTGGKGGSSELQDCGGGGGGGCVTGTIPDADLVGVNELTAFLPDPDTEAELSTYLATSLGGSGLYVSPGGPGGDVIVGSGGALESDTFDWATAAHTGGDGGVHGQDSGEEQPNGTGGGGGSSAGPSADGTVGGNGHASDGTPGAGGIAPTGGGDGGAGGAYGTLGTNGSSPGGGGGGAGDTEPTLAPAIGGNAKIILTYDTVSAPVITSGSGATAAYSVVENTTAIGTATATATDLLVWSIEESGDGAFVSVNPTTGVMAFQSAPDFESPADGDADNVYVFTLIATDGINGEVTDSQVISVTVTNDTGDDPPPEDEDNPNQWPQADWPQSDWPQTDRPRASGRSMTD